MAATWLCRLDDGPRRVNHASVLLGRYMFMIGGYYTGLDFDMEGSIDVSVFYLDLLKWEKLQLNNDEAPFMRYGHTALAYKNDIYVWGGRNDQVACDKLYKLDVRNKRWELVTTTGNKPFARDGHSACLLGSVMYIFGGYLGEPLSIYATRLYSIDLETRVWQRVRCLGEEPACRDFHSMVGLDGKLYLFGGRGTDEPPHHTHSLKYPDCLHMWCEATKTWSSRPRGADGPIGRRSLSMFVYKKRIYMFGGFNASIRQHFNDLYTYSPESDKWAEIKARGHAPAPRRRQSCVVAGSRVYVFGGTSPVENIIPDDDDEDALIDHNDMHVLDLEPTLRTLSMRVVLKNKQLDYSILPNSLYTEIYNIGKHPRNSEDATPPPLRRRRR